MDSSEIAKLERLLSAAMPGVVFRRGSSEEMSQGRYRQLLERCRTVYDPTSRFRISLLQPEIREPTLKGEILALVKRELSDHIRDGLLHSASFAMSGGRVSGSPVEDIVENLLRRTAVDGPRVAALAFAECVKNVSCNFYRYLLLPNIAIEADVELFDGVTLLPLPKTTAELPPHLPSLTTEADRPGALTPTDLLGRTILRVKCDVSPVFHRPEATYTFQSGPEAHFKTKLSGATLEIDSDALWQALSVASRQSVRPVMTWTSLADYEIFDLGSIRGIGASGWSSEGMSLPFEEPALIRRPQFETVAALYKAIIDLPTETWARLRIPIDRWMKSVEQENPIDQLIDLGIALESLYVPSAQSEVSLRFALHAAWHLGQSAGDRLQLRKEFSEIYAARSDVVHSGQLRGRRAKPDFDVSAFVRRAQDLCWQGITTIINAGQIPDWDSLVLGQDID